MDIRVTGQSANRSLREMVPILRDVGGVVLERCGMALFRWRRRLATVAIALLAVWLALHVISGPNGWVAYHKKKLENRQLQQEVQALQKENEELEGHVKALKSDPRAIEREAREQLRYARPGEVIYVLPEQKPASTPRPPSNATAEKTSKP